MKKKIKIISSRRFKGMKIECAPTTGIDMFQSIAEDFLKRILELDYADCLLTDESSISDFVDFSEDEIRKRILDTYELDVSEIKTGNLLEIFRLLHKRER